MARRKRRPDEAAAGGQSKPEEQKRPEGKARGWNGSMNKPQSGGKNMNSRAKVPFGPTGGSGRKTNLSRSS